MSKQDAIDLQFIRIAWVTALSRSKDPSTQVGAAIVSPDNRQVSLGYNGMPAGIDETPEIWARPLKYEYVIHAEENCLNNAPFDTKGCTAYVTHRPCHRCLGKLVNARISRVVWNEDHKNITNQEVWNNLARSFLEVVQINDPMIEEIKSLYKPINKTDKKIPSPEEYHKLLEEMLNKHPQEEYWRNKIFGS